MQREFLWPWPSRPGARSSRSCAPDPARWGSSPTPYPSRNRPCQHLRVLREAGLVRERREGTRRLYRVDPDGLGALRAYLDRFWDDALEAFRRFADEEGTT